MVTDVIITYVEQPKLAGPTLALRDLDGSHRMILESKAAIVSLWLTITMHVALQRLVGHGKHKDGDPLSEGFPPWLNTKFLTGYCKTQSFLCDFW